MSQVNLPIIDVSELRSRELSDRQRVAEAFRSACENHGFFYITGHGIPRELREDVLLQTRRLFDQPLPYKMAYDKALSPCNRGYQPMRGQTLQQGMAPDLKEGFYIGDDLPDTDPRVIARRFNHGANQWPAGLPHFRPVMEDYFEKMQALAVLMFRGLALSLELAEDALDGFLEGGGMGTLFLLHYPPQPANPQPGERGCGEHTDFGALTLLAQDRNGGLQVLDAERNRWIDAPPIEDTFVVNIGDLVARWTNGRYHSTLHRVVNLSGRERYSVPFFFTGHPDYEVACLPTCVTADRPARFPTVTVEQHLAECYRLARI